MSWPRWPSSRSTDILDLNEKIGGFDMDLEPSPKRMVAHAGSTATAYRAARVADARQLARVPIIDLRGQDNKEIHQSFYSYTMRARLDRTNGTHAYQVNGPAPSRWPATRRSARRPSSRWTAG